MAWWWNWRDSPDDFGGYSAKVTWDGHRDMTDHDIDREIMRKLFSTEDYFGGVSQCDAIWYENGRIYFRNRESDADHQVWYLERR